MRVEGHQRSLWEDTYEGASRFSVHATLFLAFASTKVEVFPLYDDITAAGDADCWVNQNGMPPKGVLCTLGLAASMVFGGVVGATSHIAKSVFPKP